MSTMSEQIDQWLRDAHAMEKQAETVLRGQADRLENYPDLSAKFEAHLDETISQRERLERCLERRKASTSAVKDMSARFTATMQNLSGVFAGDEVVKGAMAAYTFEHMEIASYEVLIAACEADGDMETARVCQDICDEEQAMADWLRDDLGRTAVKYLQRSESEEMEDTAKR